MNPQTQAIEITELIPEVANENAVKRIHFEDAGQDFLYCDIDYNGEIVDCHRHHRAFWLGCIIDLETLKKGRVPEYINPRIGRAEMRHKVVRIEEIES